MYYFDNPGGMIPTWLINWTAKVILNLFKNFFFKELFKKSLSMLCKHARQYSHR